MISSDSGNHGSDTLLIAFSVYCRAQVAEIDFQNVQILPNSPTQDRNNSVLSFFVNLPSGTTMPSELLRIIYSVSPNVISQPTTVVSTSQNTNLTKNQTENLVQLTAEGASQVNNFPHLFFS